MTMASGTLYFATTNGNLSAVDFTGGVPSGAATVLSGPSVDGQNWVSPRAVRARPLNRLRPTGGWYPAARRPL
jgi:hypothetical protein